MRHDLFRSTLVPLLALGVVLGVALGAAACNDDDMGPEEIVFSADLDGEAEVPPVDTEASGTATFTVVGSTVNYRIEVSDLVQVFAAHIHMASPTENGPIVVGLFAADPPIDVEGGVLIEDSFTADDVDGMTLEALLQLMQAGGTYVNVHTTANPGGEIRGQIALQ